jgi:hypothetical protein
MFFSKNCLLIFVSFLVLELLFSLSPSYFVQAQSDESLTPLNGVLANQIINEGIRAAGIPFRMDTTLLRRLDPRIYVAYLARMALLFVTLIFLGLMIYGGALWFLSKGEESKIQKSKTILSRTIIGVTILLSSYSIVSFLQWNFERITRDELFNRLIDPQLTAACGPEEADYYKFCINKPYTQANECKEAQNKFAECIKRTQIKKWDEVAEWVKEKAQWLKDKFSR